MRLPDGAARRRACWRSACCPGSGWPSSIARSGSSWPARAAPAPAATLEAARLLEPVARVGLLLAAGAGGPRPAAPLAAARAPRRRATSPGAAATSAPRRACSTPAPPSRRSSPASSAPCCRHLRRERLPAGPFPEARRPPPDPLRRRGGAADVRGHRRRATTWWSGWRAASPSSRASRWRPGWWCCWWWSACWSARRRAMTPLLTPGAPRGAAACSRSRWSASSTGPRRSGPGRKGPRLLQGFSDLRRLLRKRPVYSARHHRALRRPGRWSCWRPRWSPACWRRCWAASPRSPSPTTSWSSPTSGGWGASS